MSGSIVVDKTADVRTLLMPQVGPVTGCLPPLANRYSYFFRRRRNLEHWTVRRGAFSIIGRPDRVALAAAAELLISHHDGLRLRASGNVSAWTETVAECGAGFPFLAQRQQNQQNEADYLRNQCEEVANSFRFPGELFKVVYTETKTRNFLYFIFHHLVTDTTSINIVVQDFFQIYRSLIGNGRVDLPAKTTPFVGYCQASLRFWTGRAGNDAAYWRSIGFERRHKLLDDKELEGPANIEANSVAVLTDLPLMERDLRTLHHRTGWRGTELILAGIARAYAGWTNGGLLQLALVMHGRESFMAEVDLSRTVGWISETVPILLDGRLPRRGLLNECRQQLQQASWRGKSYGILCHLAPNSCGLDSMPSPQVSLNLKMSRAISTGPHNLFVKEPAFSLKDVEIGTTQRGFLLSGGVFLDARGRFRLSWDFSRHLFDSEEIGKYARLCAENIGTLLQP